MPLPFALPPPDPGFELFVASHGMSQGIAQTDGIQARPRLFVRFGNAQVGGQWRNISSPAANGVAILFLRYGRELGPTQLDGTAAYRVRTGVKPLFEATAWEFTGALRRKFDGWDLRLEIQYSPEEFGTGRSTYVEAGSAIQLASAVTISANVGRRERQKAPDYTSFNFGFTTAVRQRLYLDARLYGTDRGNLADPFRARVVVSGRLTF